MGSISNLFGGSSAPSISLVAIDTNLIASAQNASRNLRLVSQLQSLNSFGSGIEDYVDVSRPWTDGVDTRTDIQKRLDFLSGENLINYDQPYFKNVNNTQTDKDLFALYNGLSRMKDMADYAAKDGTSVYELTGLNTRFQKYLTEFDEALANVNLSGVTLLRGEKTDEIVLEDVTPKETGDTQTGIITDQGFEGAITALSGTETFTVRVNTTDVVMDLSEMSDTLSVKNLVAYLNTKLEDAGQDGYLTFGHYQLYDEEGFGTGEFGLKLDASTSADISFSTNSSSASATVFSNVGGTDDPGLKIDKLTGLSGSDPIVYSSKINEIFNPTEDGEEPAFDPNAVHPVTVVKGSVTDSDGNVFTVGYTDQNLGDQNNQSTSTDAFLRKYDSAGNLLWEQLLGAKDSASGVDIALDADDNVILVGQVEGDLGDQGRLSGGQDTFIAKFDNDGAPQWTRQIGASVDDDAYSVTTDASGNIYLAGKTKGAVVSGEVNQGSSDAFLLKIDANGNLNDASQFGTAGFDQAAAVAVANDGSPLVASVENGQLYLRKYDANDLSSEQWSVNLGAFNASIDQIGDIVVNGSEVYITGTSSNGALDAAGSASIVQSHSGGTDTFVMRVDDSGASATANWVSYLGTTGSDELTDVKFADNAIFFAGTTTGEFSGETAVSDKSGYVARMDTSGATEWVHQFASRRDQIEGPSLTIDEQGDSVLTKLGLGRGTYNPLDSVTITAQNTVRDGQYFYLQVDDVKKKITINDGDTVEDLKRQINRAFPFDVEASILDLSTGSKLTISARGTSEVGIVAGEGDANALPGLGIDPTSLIGGAGFVSIFTIDREDPEDLAKRPDVWGLQLTDGMNLSSKTEAARVAETLDKSLKAIRDAYRWVNPDPYLESLLGGDSNQITGTAPAYLTQQISNYTQALLKLNPSAASTLGYY